MALGVVMGVLVNTVNAQGIPVPPLRIWGSITSNLNNGYVIATTNGSTCAKGAAFSGSSYGTSPNFLNFPGDIPATTVVEGATDGQTINVFIDPSEPTTTTYKSGGGIIAAPGAPVSALNVSERLNVSIGTSANGAIYNVSGNISTSGLGSVSDATVNINWGDGTACTQTFSSGGSYSGVHGYDDDGIYTITAIAYKNGVGAGLTTTLVSVVTVVAQPTAAPSTGGGGGFGPYIPPSGGGGARRATPTPTSDELLELTIEESVDQFNDADSEAVAGWISKLSSTRSAAIFELMDLEKVIEVFATLTAETASSILDESTVAKNVEIFNSLDAEKASAIIVEIQEDKAAEVIENLSATVVAEMLKVGESSEFASIFNLVSDEQNALILESVDAEKAGEVLVLVRLSKAAGIVENIDVEKGAAIFEIITPSSGALIMETVTSQKVSDLLSLVSAIQAGTVMENLTTSSLTGVVKLMPEKKMIYRLPVMSPERFFLVPASVLLEALPSVPAEAITKEVLPKVSGNKPEVVLSTQGSSIYQQTSVGEDSWNTIISSPHPLDQVIAKFDKDINEVIITVQEEDQSTISLPLEKGESLYSAFSIALDGGIASSMTLGHVSFYVEKSWFDSKNIHKWSIRIKRYDENINKWVAHTAKRVSEDDTKVYYTVSVPSFSNMAVIGSNSIPTPEFVVKNLVLNPFFPTADEDFEISARITNTGTETLVYPANLWVNDIIENSQILIVEPGETVSFVFTENKTNGRYGLRVERLLATFQVRAKPVPTVTVAPKPKPTPVAVPSLPAQPTPKPVVTVKATPTATPLPKPTAAPAPKPTSVPVPTAVVATATAAPVVKETPISQPTPTPTATPILVEKPLEEDEEGSSTLLIIIIIVIVLVVLGGLGFVFMRGKGSGGSGPGNSPDSTSDKESSYTELDDLISGKDEDNKEDPK